jgi:hypothetical protein
LPEKRLPMRQLREVLRLYFESHLAGRRCESASICFSILKKLDFLRDRGLNNCPSDFHSFAIPVLLQPREE